MIRIGLWIAACVLLSVSAATVSAQATEQTPAAQILGLAMNPPSIPTPAMQDYVNAALRAHNAGVDGNEFTVKWSELEPSAGQLKVDDFVGGMNDYLNFFHDTALVGLQVLNTTAKETPSDLINVPFDDPRMLDRFKALIDAMLAQATHPITYLSIGNEVDVYLANHPQEWAAYTTFYAGAAAYVHQVAPEIEVGVTVTYKGLLDHTAEVTKLNQPSDVFILTYYPLSDLSSPKIPVAPLHDFPTMIRLAKGCRSCCKRSAIRAPICSTVRRRSRRSSSTASSRPGNQRATRFRFWISSCSTT